jgi:uncharacterized protein HemX
MCKTNTLRWEPGTPLAQANVAAATTSSASNASSPPLASPTPAPPSASITPSQVADARRDGALKAGLGAALPLAVAAAAFLLLWLHERRRGRRSRQQALTQQVEAQQHGQQALHDRPLLDQPLIQLSQYDSGAAAYNPDNSAKRHAPAELSTT